MKSLQQHISQMKTLHSLNEFIAEHISQVDEKLIINKNYKSPGINNTIYDAFKKDFQWISRNNMWGMYEDLNDVIAIDKVILKKLNDIIRPRIPKDKRIFVHYVTLKKATNIFYNMLDLLNRKHDDIDFLCNDAETKYANSMSKSKVIIKVFETDEHVIGLVGPENKSDSTSLNTIIIFAYKFEYK